MTAVTITGVWGGIGAPARRDGEPGFSEDADVARGGDVTADDVEGDAAGGDQPAVHTTDAVARSVALEYLADIGAHEHDAENATAMATAICSA